MASREQLRAALWAARDWAGCLARLAGELRAAPLSRALVEPAVMLARAFEAIEPDRSHAVRMYFLAWNAWPDRGPLLRRAIELCREIGDLERAAVLARLGYQHSGDPRAALAEGVAWLDANRPADAVEPLVAARSGLPDHPMVGLLVATAMQEWSDPRAQVRALMEQGTAAGYACAARIVRSAGFDGDDYGGLLARAFRADPTDDSIRGLFEDWLVGRGDREGLAELYRVRAAAAASPEALIEEYRRAGTRLVRRDLLAGLGLRLLERSVSHGYEAGVATIPGHIASLSLIREYAVNAGLEGKFLHLLAAGLDRSMPAYDRLWMAIAGLETADRAGEHDTAQAYAAIVAELAPEHPVLQDYCVDAGLAEERWAISREAVTLDHFTSGQHVVAEDWRRDKVGLAAAEVDAPPPDPALALPSEIDMTPFATGPALGPPEVEALDDAPVIEDAATVAAPTAAAIIPSSAMAALRRHRDGPLEPPAAAQGPRPRARRAMIAADVRVIAGARDGARELVAITRDLSETGLFLVTEAALTIGARLRIELELPGDDAFAVQSATLDARVVRRGANGYGVVFLDPPAAAIARIAALSG